MQTKEQVLQACTIEGTTVKLPAGELDRKLYMDVAKSLQLIGGKWKGGKTWGFVFDLDPTELLAEIAGGEKRNLKKEFQFFATPDDLADEMVELSGVNETHSVLEPSAGMGAIVKAIHRVRGVRPVSCYEAMPTNQIILKKIPSVVFHGEDFMTHTGIKFDRIIANPPFTKNQDIDHIRKMYDCLKPGGVLVTLSSPSWQNESNKKQVEFKNWLDDLNADISDVAPGTFKESGTSIRTVLIKIRK